MFSHPTVYEKSRLITNKQDSEETAKDPQGKPEAAAGSGDATQPIGYSQAGQWYEGSTGAGMGMGAGMYEGQDMWNGYSGQGWDNYGNGMMGTLSQYNICNDINITSSDDANHNFHKNRLQHDEPNDVRRLEWG